MAIRVVVQPKPKVTLRVQPRIPPQEVSLQNTGDWVQWKLGEGPWQDLIEVAELGDSAMYAGQAAQSALEAAGSASAAQGSATAAGNAASAAGDAQEAAEIAQGLAEQAVVDAGDAKDAAEAAQLLAETARGEAEGFKDDAENAKDAAEDARDLALAYADEDEDVPVAPGVYSAKHWSAKATAAEGAAKAAQLAAEAAQLAAETAEGHAEGFKDEAELARDEAVGAAAGVNLPIIGAGDAGKTLVVTVAEDGYELIDPVAAAADVTFDPSGTGLSATDVQAALAELDASSVPSGGTIGQVLAKASSTDHDTEWVDPVADAEDVEFTPAGSLTSTTVQDALEELDTEKATTTDVAAKIGGTTGSTDNRLLRADGTGSKLVQGSVATLDDSGNLSGIASVAISLSGSGDAIDIDHSGTGNAIDIDMTGTGTQHGLSIVNLGSGSNNNTCINITSQNPNSSTMWVRGCETSLGTLKITHDGQSGDVNASGLSIQMDPISPSGDSEARGINVRTFNTAQEQVFLNDGTQAIRLSSGGGSVFGAATGGKKGAGTINAKAVYDDNSELTCMAMSREFIESGTIDLEKWDAFVPDETFPEQRELRPVMVTWKQVKRVAAAEPGLDGRLHRRQVLIDIERKEQMVVAEPVYDDDGRIVDAVETPLFEEVVTPARVVRRQHRTARVFKAMVEAGFDPRDPEQYFARMRADEALPGMPTQAEWEHGGLSLGEQFSRKWLAMEMLAIVANVMWLKLKDHEARIRTLEASL